MKILILISLVLFGNFAQVESCGKLAKTIDAIIEPGVDQSKKTEKFLTISGLNAEKPSKGVFETRGFVAKIYTCPPCPPHAQCKPCMGDNIVISEEKKNLDTYDLSEKEMIIFSVEAKKFSKGNEYRFKFEIHDQKSTSSNLNDSRLIRADLVKD